VPQGAALPLAAAIKALGSRDAGVECGGGGGGGGSGGGGDEFCLIVPSCPNGMYASNCLLHVTYITHRTSGTVLTWPLHRTNCSRFACRVIV
jgi:hypothetical protein